MCSWCITFGVSAIAAITSSLNSAGWGEVKRTRSSPSTSPQARSSFENACRSPNSTPYALTFCPSNVTSETPSPTSARTSARMSPGRRSFSLPRRLGTMQKVQVLLHPTLTLTQAAYADSRRVGSVDGKTSSDSRISTCASSCTRARSRSAGREPMLWVPKTTSTHGAFLVIVARSFCARQPPTAICMPGRAALTGARWPRLP